MEECHYCEGTDNEEEVYREIIECITGALDARMPTQPDIHRESVKWR